MPSCIKCFQQAPKYTKYQVHILQFLVLGWFDPGSAHLQKEGVEWKRNSRDIKKNNEQEWTFTWILHSNANLQKNQCLSRDVTEVAQDMEFTPKEHHWPEPNQN